MKTKQFSDITEQILNNNELANIFNVYIVPNETTPTLQFNINKTVSFKNSDKILRENVGTYVVMPGDTWQLISLKVYNDLHLWWVLCKFNNINDPTSLPVEGSTLQVLNPNLVQQVASQLKDL